MKVDLNNMFGNDYYSIGLFSCVVDIDPNETISIDEVINLCYQIKYDYYDQVALNTIYLIIKFFIKADSLNTLIMGYVPYNYELAINKYNVDNYLNFSINLVEQTRKVSKTNMNISDEIVELFNMVNAYYLYDMYLRIK